MSLRRDPGALVNRRGTFKKNTSQLESREVSKSNCLGGTVLQIRVPTVVWLDSATTSTSDESAQSEQRKRAGSRNGGKRVEVLAEDDF